MKPIRISLPAIILSLVTSAAALDVHEWGTFTTFAGSTGEPLVWYLPHSDQARLPDFVMSDAFLTKAAPALLRMETPVIYFYPDGEQAVSVTVEAGFQRGSITESYPFSTRSQTPIPGSARWTGTLHPPGDPHVQVYIPPVVDDDPHEPYAAARNVPDAWIFKSNLEVVGQATPQAEKFIFYRGAGQAAPEIAASIDKSGTVTLRNFGSHRYSTSIVLRVADGKAGWVELPELAPRGPGGVSQVVAELAGSPRGVEVVEAELAIWFVGKLQEEGLTAAEAAAMVATWRGTWFREEGLRVLSLVPRDWVDEVLPLSIDPQPANLVRVFVARLEVLEPAKESALVALLNHPEPADAAFIDLRLGRFGHGALERAVNLESMRLKSRFRDLEVRQREILSATDQPQ